MFFYLTNEINNSAHNFKVCFICLYLLYCRKHLFNYKIFYCVSLKRKACVMNENSYAFKNNISYILQNKVVSVF